MNQENTNTPLNDGLYFQMVTVKDGVIFPGNRLMSASLFVESILRKTSDALVNSVAEMLGRETYSE